MKVEIIKVHVETHCKKEEKTLKIRTWGPMIDLSQNGNLIELCVAGHNFCQ